ncbi:MAG: pyruvate dehydrogenase (acetyl-transferring), homodimeric type [Acidobacteria bacterium]|nr:pyruvate dehydrogenase (acetyl-transferring), homodimeric type [Acidobacteriota bacterium]MBI3658162.1 pyruvate dehydrogenase (acetyl-transferring), homodimeric type [Acidobacteriota bacterium]
MRRDLIIPDTALPYASYVGRSEDSDSEETREWLESLDDVIDVQGPERMQFLLRKLLDRAHRKGLDLPFTANTPYVNTIAAGWQPVFPGDRIIERRIKSLIRWNAMAMVVRANKKYPGIGGHISTYASAATLYEVGFNHFFRGQGEGFEGDQIFFQGHAAPGIYARAFLEGRLTFDQMENFRHELAKLGGLSSYPHPWLMPNFWEFPTVSMGLGAITAIYQARFNRYMADRGIKDTEASKVWAFLGDGETDEPETLGAITLASRERLDNLIFVINCNLQRLDGPVRGNGKIIQELEAIFRGAGWNVIKVIWGDDWDPLLAQDTDGILVKRMTEVVDGHFQKHTVESGEYIRRTFFGDSPALLKMVEHLSDNQLKRLRRGGHDPAKVYAAYKAAVEFKGAPTVVLAKTVKGYGLGESGEGRNITHQQKKLNEAELREFRDRFNIPIPDSKIMEAPFYRPPDTSEEVRYLLERRRKLGGFVPQRKANQTPLAVPELLAFQEFFKGSSKAVSTTMVFVQLLAQLLKDSVIGKRIVPIVPDEARTFGMETLFRQVGIYSHVGQVYEPVDSHMFLYYREAQDGQILEEGITEAGSMASFTAAGTAYSSHGTDMIPFFIYYSMFGFQRIGDLIWAFGDMRGRGFLLGGTAGRTTLNGEGLQHGDGHSHVLAGVIPNLVTYDPAYAYEIAVIIQNGLKRMYQDREDIFYYLTLGNENYPMPPMPAQAEEGILKGLYKLKPAEGEANWPSVHLFGSGSILRESLRAQDILASQFQVAADVWSVTSYKELRRDALAVERWNRLHPCETQRKPYITTMLEKEPAPVIAATDYMKLVPDQVARWAPIAFVSLGTDGFGRSETREALRRFFEVDAESIAIAALHELAKEGKVSMELVGRAIAILGIDPNKSDPLVS